MIRCDNCGHTMFVNSTYNNMYGHKCHKCDFFIQPVKKPTIIQKNQIINKSIKQFLISKIRKQFKRK